MFGGANVELSNFARALMNSHAAETARAGAVTIEQRVHDHSSIVEFCGW